MLHPQQGTRSAAASPGNHPAFDLSSFARFAEHPWVTPLCQKYERDAVVAECAVARLVHDLEDLQNDFQSTNSRVLFTNVEGRVKTRESFLRKLFKICCKEGRVQGISPQTLESMCATINDLAGVRFSCPYYDEVEQAIQKIIRPALTSHGYATDLGPSGLPDKDCLDDGDELGYRSYHFFVRVPTIIDVFGSTELFLCEIQGRSELQHVWAAKSHNLLYKPKHGWQVNDSHVVEDMHHLSNSLRTADQFLMSIRDRAGGAKA